MRRIHSIHHPPLHACTGKILSNKLIAMHNSCATLDYKYYLFSQILLVRQEGMDGELDAVPKLIQAFDTILCYHSVDLKCQWEYVYTNSIYFPITHLKLTEWYKTCTTCMYICLVYSTGCVPSLLSASHAPFLGLLYDIFIIPDVCVLSQFQKYITGLGTDH